MAEIKKTTSKAAAPKKAAAARTGAASTAKKVTARKTAAPKKETAAKTAAASTAPADKIVKNVPILAAEYFFTRKKRTSQRERPLSLMRVGFGCSASSQAPRTPR